MILSVLVGILARQPHRPITRLDVNVEAAGFGILHFIFANVFAVGTLFLGLLGVWDWDSGAGLDIGAIVSPLFTSIVVGNLVSLLLVFSLWVRNR